MTEELKPCPFCDSTTSFSLSNSDAAYSIQCDYCGCQGPSEQTESQAETAWNTRTDQEA